MIFAGLTLNKVISVFLLAFQAIFLNVIVPGHTRGIITLSGKSSFARMADLGCPLCCQPLKNDRKNAPNGKDRSECAICHLAIRLIATPVFDFRLGELGLLEWVQPPAPEPAPTCIVVPVRHCRGPPVIPV